MEKEKKVERLQRVAICLRSLWTWSIGFALGFFILSAILNLLNVWIVLSVLILLALINAWALIDTISFFKALEDVEEKYHYIVNKVSEKKSKSEKNSRTNQEILDYYQNLEKECADFIESCDTLLTHKGLKKGIQFELNLFRKHVSDIYADTKQILQDF